jgi:hypothetical protein
MALGLVLIFKSSYIFNFAQGQLLLIGALITWWFSVELGLPLWVSIALALILSALLGLAIERVTLRPMTGQPLLSIILMTLGLSQVLQGSALLLFGGSQRNFPQIFSAGDPYKITTPFMHEGNPDARYVGRSRTGTEHRFAYPPYLWNLLDARRHCGDNWRGAPGDLEWSRSEPFRCCSGGIPRSALGRA